MVVMVLISSSGDFAEEASRDVDCGGGDGRGDGTVVSWRKT